MRLNRSCQYATAACAHLAGEPRGQRCSSHVIARARKIPDRYLRKVLRPLAAAGILRSVKGPRGGYCLARRPESISMLDIVEAVEGPILGAVASVDAAEDRALEFVCQRVAEGTRAELKAWSLARFLNQAALEARTGA